MADCCLFIFYGVRASWEALDIHSCLPHMQQFLDVRMDYLEQDFQIRLIDMLSPAASGR